MNWAAQHELPEGQKTPHFAVAYEAHAKGTDRCATCRNFISPRRCRTVQTPVAGPAWCKRFDSKEGG